MLFYEENFLYDDNPYIDYAEYDDIEIRNDSYNLYLNILGEGCANNRRPNQKRFHTAAGGGCTGKGVKPVAL